MNTVELEKIVETALGAPSLTNRKPWKFRFVGNVIELYSSADIEISPRLRNISVGALLHYMRLLIRGNGRQEIIHLFPRLDDPNLIAYIRMNGDHTPSETDLTLSKIVQGLIDPRECGETWCKNKFKSTLKSVESNTNTIINLFNDLSAPQTTSKLDRFVDAQKNANKKAVDDLSEEMKDNGNSELSELCAFNNAEIQNGSIQCGSDQIDPESKSEYVLVSTDVENSYSWISAGEAMARIHLYLKQCGFFAMAVMPIIENSDSRAWLSESLGSNGWPQILLKLGKIEKNVNRPGLNLNDFMLSSSKLSLSGK